MLRTLKYFLLLVAGLGVLLGIALFGLRHLDVEHYRTVFTRAVEAVTDRQVQIGGAFTFNATLSPSFSAENVTFANAAFGSEPYMFTAERIDVGMELLPLLRGRICIDSVHLVRPRLLLETSAGDLGNWRFHPGDPPPEKIYPVQMNRIDIEDGVIIYVNGETGTRQEYHIESLGASRNPLTDIVRAKLEGDTRGFHVSASGTLGKLGHIFDDRANQIRLTARTAQVDWRIEGTVGKVVPKLRAVDLAMRGQAAALTDVNPLGGTELPDLGPLTATARLLGSEPHFSLQDIQAELHSDRRTARVTGGIDELGRDNQMDFQFNARDNSVAGLFAAFDADLPLDGKATATGWISGEPDTLALQQLRLRLDGPQAQARFEGAVADLDHLSGLVLRGRADLTTLAALAGLVRRPLPDVGPLQASAEIRRADGIWSVRQLVARIQGSHAHATISGTIANAALLTGVRLQVTAGTDRTSMLGTLLEYELPDLGTLNGSAEVLSKKNELTLKNASLTLAGGALKATARGTITDLRGLRGVSARITADAASLAALSDLVRRPLPVSGPLSLAGKLTYGKSGGSDTGMDLQLTGTAFEAQFRGRVKTLAALSGLVGTFRLNATSTAELARLGGVKLPAVGALAIQGEVARHTVSQPDTWINASIKADAVNGTIQGTLGTDAPPAVMVKVTADQLSDLSVLAGTDLPASGPFSGQARVGTDGDALTLDKLDLKLADSDVTGRLRVNLATGSGPRQVSGTLSSNQFDLAAVLGEPGNGSAQSNDVGATKSRYLFPAEPFKLDVLHKVDFDVQLQIKRLVARVFLFNNVNASVRSTRGRLDVPFTARLKSGTISARLRANANTEPATITARLDIEGMDPRRISALQNQTMVHDGLMDLRVDLAGQGDSVHAVLGTANGEAVLVIHRARVNEQALQLIGADILSQLVKAINPFRKQNEFLDLRCGYIGFRISGGVARSNKTIALQSKEVNVVGSGVINLNTEKIQLVLSPRARQGLGLSASSLAKLVAVGGHLKQPRIEINPAGLLKSGAAIGVAVASGGLSLLVQGLFARFTAKTDVCQAAADSLAAMRADAAGESGQATAGRNARSDLIMRR